VFVCVCLSVCLSVYLYVAMLLQYVCLFVCLSVYLYVAMLLRYRLSVFIDLLLSSIPCSVVNMNKFKLKFAIYS